MDFDDDYILRLAKSAGRFAGKVLFNKESKEMESINWKSINGEDIIPILIKRLTLEGKYNDAENIIFEQLEKNPSEEIYNLAKKFYNTLLSKSDEELQKADFSREEINMGLADIEKYL